MSDLDHEIHELEKRLSELESQMISLTKNLGVMFERKPEPEVSPKILKFIHQGKKAQAIKLYREETGASLKDAKEFIDSLDV